jgi:hypothetical protein
MNVGDGWALKVSFKRTARCREYEEKKKDSGQG